jgi:equilibrative nucleoside transporter 1/2/3
MKFILYNRLILITIFNVGDIIGKWVGGYRKYYTLKIQYILVGSRSLFVIFFILISANYDSPGAFIEADWFACIIMFFFAITNGFTT